VRHRRIGPAFLLVAALLAASAFFRPAAAADAQTEPAAKSVGSAAEIQQLIDILENDEARQRLIDQLRAAAAAQEVDKPASEPTETGGIATRSMTAIADSASDFGSHVIKVLSFIGDAPRFITWFQIEASQPQNRERVLIGLRDLALALGLGWLAEAAARAATRGWRRRLESGRPATAWRRARTRTLYGILGLAPIVVFWLIATLALAVQQPADTASLVATTLINAHAAAQALAWLVHILFVPQAAALRLLPLPDKLAAKIDRWVKRTVRIAIYGYGICLATLFMGLPETLVSFLLRVLGLAVAALLITLVLRLRHAIALLIREAAAGSSLRLNTPVARYWHLPLLAYILVALFIWLAQPADAMTFLVRATLVTVVLVGLVTAAVLAANRLLGRWVDRAPWLQRRGFAFRSRVSRYLQGVRIILSIVAIAVTALTVIEAWGIDAADWFERIGGPRVVSGLMSIGVILIVAIVVWESISVVIERRLATSDDGTLEGLRRAARLRTLMPLFDRVTFIALAAAVILIGLSELGIDIAPLLAGAGVVGIAVGFGAQAVVKDVLGGMSAILEGSMSVGDVVSVGDKSGVVEAMSLRMLKLRDFDGTLHTIPFGEVTRISNLTKDYSYAVFRIALSYSADIEKAQEIVKQIIAGMREDSAFKRMILGDLELHGVDAFTDTSVVLLARVKVAPAAQWNVTREFHVRLKEEFDRHGVPLSVVQRTVAVSNNPPQALPAEPRPQETR